jgi:hypothetical protein
MKERISLYNEKIGYERISKLKPYGNLYGFLNRQGIIEKTFSRHNIEKYLRIIDISKEWN